MKTIVKRAPETEEQFKGLPSIYRFKLDGIFFPDWRQAREYQDQLDAEEDKSEKYKSQLSIVHKN